MRSLALLLLLVAPAAEAGKVVRSSMGGSIVVDSAPNGATLRTMGGDIRVRSAGGDVVARTMGGSIRVQGAAASVDADTMGGNVDVEVVGAGKNRTIEADSMGGSIEVTLPAGFSGTFELELEQDDDDKDRKRRIVSDFPLQLRETTRRRWFRTVTVITATGRIGAGDNRVKVTTVGGDITIRRK